MNYESTQRHLSAGPDEADDQASLGGHAVRGAAAIHRAAAAVQRVELQLRLRQPLRQHGAVGHGDQRAALPGRHHPGEPDPERQHVERVVRDHQLRRQRRVAVAPVLGGHLRRDLLLHRPGGPDVLPGEDGRHHRRALEHALLRRAEPLRPELRHLRPAGLDVLLADDGDVGLVGVVERRLWPVGRGGEHVLADQLCRPGRLRQPGTR